MEEGRRWHAGQRRCQAEVRVPDIHFPSFKAAETKLDPVKRAALLIKLNDLVIAGGYIIPIANRQRVRALANKLNAPLSAWDNDSWALGFWSRDA